MYWFVEYEKTPHLENTKIFLIESSNFLEAQSTAYRLIGSGKCTIVLLTVEHLIGKYKFYNGVSMFQ